MLRLAFVLLLLSFPITSYSAYQVIAPFWVSKIDSALYLRDAYYKSVLPDTSNFSLVLLNDIQRQMVCDRITVKKDTLSPWYHFLAGIIECDRSKPASSMHFSASLALAKQDPGTTWALFVEFTRNRQNVWAERCLMHLEKLFLASGASSAPAIAQQLLFYAQQNEKAKDLTSAFSYYAWAERFDPLQVWSGVHRLRNCIPSHPRLFFTTLSNLADKCAGSWQLQLRLISHTFDWVWIFCLTFVISVFIGLGARLLPSAVHPVVDRLPDTVPSPLKTVLPIVVLLSFVSFGLLPFLWLVAFLIWQFADKKEKILAGAAILMLTVSPLAIRFQHMLFQARSPQSSLMIFTRALQEGYQGDLHQSALKKVIVDPADALAYLSSSLFSLKQKDTAASRVTIQKAVDLRNNDRVFLTFAGNNAYQSGDYTTAVRYYQQVLTKYPDDMTARFNLAQCYARNADTTIDLDFMKMLSPGKQTRINDFINENTVYFLNSWPVCRQVMNPDFSGREFWLSIFPAYGGSWNTAKVLWGPAFFGLPLLPSLMVFIFLFFLLVVWGLTPAAHAGAASTGTCRLCKRTICRQCGKKELCPACAQKTQYIRNVKSLAAIQSTIMHRQRRIRGLFGHLLDVALPGSGMLFANTHRLMAIVPLLVLTSTGYATFACLSGAHLAYPHWAAYGIMEKLPFAVFVYNGIFLIRTIVFLFRKKEPILA
ncbi:MAG: tetratricopeptide repeat protein [Chitinispirillaceae bacterium]|nr:tetratricopeptide repeat protein [Chitinispirillaceae bacterium]